MKTIEDIRHENLLAVVADLGSNKALADLIQKDPAQVSQWINKSPNSKTGKPRNVSSETARLIELATGKPTGWMDAPHQSIAPKKDANPAKFGIQEAREGYGAQAIEFVDAIASCGGGAVNHDADLRPPLLKEPSWFRRYQISPQDALAVWADGDSMADFIVDGDIVIFNRRKTTPRSGQIFLIEHPDGLRIKRLRRAIDGTWVLESNNPNKQRHPDEPITPDQADLLRIVGEFVYRQGG